jgi:hypothetical protein
MKALDCQRPVGLLQDEEHDSFWGMAVFELSVIVA